MGRRRARRSAARPERAPVERLAAAIAGNQARTAGVPKTKTAAANCPAMCAREESAETSGRFLSGRTREMRNAAGRKHAAPETL